MNINVLIIEDDFRIADIHKEIIEQLDFCKVIHSSLTATDALTFLEYTNQQPEIILLDIFIPDVKGLELLEKLKRNYPYSSIVIASAANDTDTVLSARKIGVFDYLVKPIDHKRLQLTFKQYKSEMNHEEKTWSQARLNELFHIPNQPVDKKANARLNSLPKGIDHLTLDEITTFLNNYSNDYVTAQTLVDEIGVSRSTARRYLEYLDVLNVVQATLHYGQVGRPQRMYLLRGQNEQN